MPDNQDGQSQQQWQVPQQSQFPQGQQPETQPQPQQGQQPQQSPYQQPQQYQQQMPYPQQDAYSQQQGIYPQQQQQQYPQQYGMPHQGDYPIEQPQPNYGQMPYGQMPYGQYGQYGQQYGMGQPQMGYNQQWQTGGVPMAPGGYDPLARNAYISLGVGIVGMLLLLVGKVWGIIFCCIGISLGIKGLYSRARVAGIIGIVLNSISLVISLLVFFAQCSELMS